MKKQPARSIFPFAFMQFAQGLFHFFHRTAVHGNAHYHKHQRAEKDNRAVRASGALFLRNSAIGTDVAAAQANDRQRACFKMLRAVSGVIARGLGMVSSDKSRAFSFGQPCTRKNISSNTPPAHLAGAQSASIPTKFNNNAIQKI